MSERGVRGVLQDCLGNRLGRRRTTLSLPVLRSHCRPRRVLDTRANPVRQVGRNAADFRRDPQGLEVARVQPEAARAVRDRALDEGEDRAATANSPLPRKGTRDHGRLHQLHATLRGIWGFRLLPRLRAAQLAADPGGEPGGGAKDARSRGEPRWRSSSEADRERIGGLRVSVRRLWQGSCAACARTARRAQPP